LLFVSVALIVFSVTNVEYLIQANQIVDLSDILSIGQFVPLLVGCFSLAFGIVEVREQLSRPRCWTLFRFHLI
jgi:hypothetical protein